MKKLLIILTMLPFVSFGQDTAGVVAHWKMNGDATDASGHGHNGTAHYLTSDTGRYGAPNTAYYFNGTTSFLSAPASVDYNLNKFTLGVTFKIKGFYSGTCQENVLFSKGNPSPSIGTGNYQLGFQDNPYDSGDCYTFDSTKEVLYGSAGPNVVYPVTSWVDTPLVQNKWYTAVLVYDSLHYKIYIDGTLRITINSLANPIGTSTDSIVIGMNVWQASAGFPYNFKGLIDDAILYNRVWSDSEIIKYTTSTSESGYGHNNNGDSTKTAINNVNDPSHFINVYPNPTKDNFRVSFSQPFNGSIALINTIGQVVLTDKINGDKKDINIAGLPIGLYLLKVYNDEQTIYTRVLKTN